MRLARRCRLDRSGIPAKRPNTGLLRSRSKRLRLGVSTTCARKCDADAVVRLAGGRRRSAPEVSVSPLFSPRKADQGPLKALPLRAHSDDIQIGCGGSVLELRQIAPLDTRNEALQRPTEYRRAEEPANFAIV